MENKTNKKKKRKKNKSIPKTTKQHVQWKLKTNSMDNHLPETILAEILGQFPIKSIAIFKLVCGRWKSIVESVDFRDLFLSMHHKSSSWSLLQKFRHNHNTPRGDLIAFHGCERWGLPRSLASYMSTSPFLASGIEIVSYIKTTASGLLLIQTLDDMYYVVNHVSRECVKIPPC